MGEANVGQGLFSEEQLRVIDRPVFPEANLRRAYWEAGASKDQMTQILVSKIIQELIDFGVSPPDVKFHLTDQAKEIK